MTDASELPGGIRQQLESQHGLRVRAVPMAASESDPADGDAHVVILDSRATLRQKTPHFDILTDHVKRLQSQGLAVVLLADHEGQSVPPYDALLSASGADGVIVDLEPVEQLASALWSAYYGQKRLRQVAEQLEQANRSLEDRKAIDQACQILARRREISESDAVRMLRHEARSRRVAMAELARSILAAGPLFEA
ncbi:MAG: ANTAR domain-containing protein [Planctomycetales bacterium]|nr:ANTAR domain-containing protein [Planctomycetales bacterium]